MQTRRISRGRATSREPELWTFQWSWLPGPEARADDELMQACASLFSSHYGTWGANGPRPGEKVTIGPRMVAKFLDDPSSWLACAYQGPELIGFCSSLRIDVPGRGAVSWVTRLVVHTGYRRQRIATKLLYGTWQFSDLYAWGLATANPLAVRALETATRRPCRRSVITRQGPPLMEELAPRTYLPDQLLTPRSGRVEPKVHTDFHLDLTDLPKLRELAARGDRPWSLGSIDPGEEWFACTFRSQPPEEMDEDRFNDLLLGADDIWVQAYENMTLDEGHRWHAYPDSEVDWIVERASPVPGSRVLDVGCGDGRHAAELAGRGFQVTAVDISPVLVERAREQHPASGVDFEVTDAREGLPDGPFDLALLLYDVLGSSTNVDDDRRLVRNVFRHLRPGGVLVASVMNTAAIDGRIPDDHLPRDRQELVAALEDLPPSRTMETSGNIFDPALLLRHGGVYYRKEQFEGSTTRLPAELVVRDRRYSAPELRQLLQYAGFAVSELLPVQLGKWAQQPTLDEDDERAKELLVLARRPAE